MGRDTRVLLFATTTGYQIRSFGEAAERVGVRLVFASDRCDRLEDPWWDGAIPVRFHEETQSLAAIRGAFRLKADAIRPDGVLAVGDRPTVLAALAAAAFGLPGHPPAAARASRNKLESHAALAAAGLPVTRYEAVRVDTDARALAARVAYPAVIKPLALSGSRGVIRVDDAQGLVAALERLRRILASPDVRLEHDAAHDLALVEAFIPGREFAVEGVLDRGRFQLFAIFEKPDPLDGPYFEETIYVTPPRASAAEQRAIVEAVAAAARALELWHGPVHAECRVLPGGADLDAKTGGADLHGPRVYVLEVAARPIGGLCSRAVRFAEGRSLEEVLLRHAIGEDVSGIAPAAGASGVMMIPIPGRGVFRGVEGEQAAAAVPGVESIHITARRDALLVPLPEGRSYLGFIFARAGTPDQVEGALREAHARLRFEIEKEIPVVSGPA